MQLLVGHRNMHRHMHRHTATLTNKQLWQTGYCNLMEVKDCAHHDGKKPSRLENPVGFFDDGTSRCFRQLMEKQACRDQILAAVWKTCLLSSCMSKSYRFLIAVSL